MNGIHPKLIRAAMCAVFAASLGGGCKSTSSGVASNPFMAPDRVAPPSTRVLAPGQAQPYYQGDPLPVMQSAITPPAEAALATDDAAARSATGKTLAWNSPAGGSPTPPTAPPPSALAAAPWGSNPAQPPAAPLVNEAPVGVPTDTADLRFALPAAGAPETSEAVAAAVPAVQPTAQQGASVPIQGVVPASYNAPAPGGLQPLVGQPQLIPTPAVESPWRTPQVSQAPVAAPTGQPTLIAQSGMQPLLMPGPPANPLVQPAIAPPTNMMAVQMRAVPSPPQPGDPAPRIRIPGYAVPQTAAADGFRARSSMR